MRPEIVFLSPFVYLEYKIYSFWGVKSNFQLKFYRKDHNLKKNYIKIERNHDKYHVFTQNFNPQKLLEK